MYIRCVGFTLAGRIYEYKFHDSFEENGSIATSTKVKASEKVNAKSFGGLSVWRETDVKGFDPDQWIVEQVWVPNPNDGVKVPIFIVRDKTLRKTGDSFCFLYGSPPSTRLHLIVGTAGSVFQLRRHFRLLWRPC
jgi:prolyl oligopeptidase PreP (S9A serine peptidase family)